MKKKEKLFSAIVEVNLFLLFHLNPVMSKNPGIMFIYNVCSEDPHHC